MPAWAQSEPYLVKDINPTGGSNSNPSELTPIGGTVFFRATQPGTGQELWKSDGTAQGTMLVRDIVPGYESGQPHQLVNVNGTLFFVAYEEASGYELWKSDGTAAGTVIVKDAIPGPGSPGPRRLVAHGNDVYYVNFEEDYGAELWKSDGTEVGTYRVKDIVPGIEGSDPLELTSVGGTLFFRALESGGAYDYKLWKSDGTAAGTSIVKDVDSGHLTGCGGLLYFAGTTAAGSELWRSDGTAAGTYPVSDFIATGNYAYPMKLVDFGGTLLFFVVAATPSGSEYQLWTSDGTAAGTKLVKAGFPVLIYWADAVAGALYFTYRLPGADRSEFWTSDGTTAGTFPVDMGDVKVWGNPGLVGFGGALVMTASTDEVGGELFRQDPDTLTWSVIRDIAPGPVSGSGGALVVGDRLFLGADDRVHGGELWTSDGTSWGTRLVKDINPRGGSDSSPILMSVFGDRLFFMASEALDPHRLWVTDGTSFNTIKLNGNHPGGLHWPWPLGEAGGTYLIAGQGAGNELGLWRSDGTADGTVHIKEINPLVDSYGWYPKHPVEMGGKLFFSALDPDSGRELWSSDGTSAGTGLVIDVAPGASSSEPENLTVVSNSLYFTTTLSGTTSSNYLWKSDGTAAGTVLVKEIWQGGGTGDPEGGPTNLIEFEGKLHFLADDGIAGWQLWASDGTGAGTQPVTALGFAELVGLARAGDLLFLLGWDGASASELWTSDGTAAGTKLVQSGFGEPRLLIGMPMAVGDRVYFRIDDGIHGVELWCSNGTPAGTYMLKDVMPGQADSHPRILGTRNGLVVFAAEDETHGHEPWITDGTPAGTRLVADLNPGRDGSYPGYGVVMNNTLYVQARDGERGSELWAFLISPDSDGDGLPDEWEKNGYTHPNGQFVDLPGLGANWQHKDLFIEIDYMKSAQYDHKPDPAALTEIVGAFARGPVANPDGNDGITLHINARAGSESVLAFEDPLGSGPDPNHYDWTRFDQIKAASFAKELEWSHHYCIFAHTLPTGDGTNSGLSRGFGANDFIVSLGSRTNGVGTQDQQAGTFMHELGHNLGLGHGGTDDVNFKPNYLSVMNWNFQMRGLIHTDPLRKWDYSRDVLPDLDENYLIESLGLAGSAISAGYGTIYWCHMLSLWKETAAGSANLPIDWDCSGAIETAGPVPADLDKDFLPLVSGGIVLQGYEAKAPLRGACDWDRLLFGAGRIGGGAPLPPRTVTPAEEIDLETEDELRPDPPGKVRGHVAKGKIVLTWKPSGPRNSGISYRVYRRGGGTQGMIGVTELSNFHDGNVVSGTDYVYSVAWVDAQGVESAPSEVTLTAK